GRDSPVGARRARGVARAEHLGQVWMKGFTEPVYWTIKQHGKPIGSSTSGYGRVLSQRREHQPPSIRLRRARKTRSSSSRRRTSFPFVTRSSLPSPSCSS